LIPPQISFWNVVVAITANGGDWRSKSITISLMFSTRLDGFYFSNCVL
jgi:hypothetical protein